MFPRTYPSFQLPLIVAALAGLICAVTSCGGPAERIRETSSATPTALPTPAERSISGVFKVEGSGDNGADPYTGVLSVAPKGDIYEFRWTTSKGSRIGAGVQIGNAAAVSFAPTGGGKGCGAVLYRIASDGTLEGRITRWGETSFAMEKASRTEGNSFVGKYAVTGTTADGKPYSGALTIKRDGGGYDFDWKTDEARVAFGTWKGSVAAASFGGRQCSFALYDIQSNGNLQGDWGGQAAVTLGTETAKLQ
ncbi:MAG TPA: hypothetical protein VNA17_10975 [Pyrinomonadaceae bacterium]|nr:hypothetical protein [Pyrinomonadaceae bacterium]